MPNNTIKFRTAHDIHAICRHLERNGTPTYRKSKVKLNRFKDVVTEGVATGVTDGKEKGTSEIPSAPEEKEYPATITLSELEAANTLNSAEKPVSV
ncbi:hypothetical protein GN244_ATG04955 [Phytophthora infestans]|uniref:Uncharacterized protein n=1 Tax=Phytophthora infestans TaxID=4787 RepID=A0A833W554_PHYIN|nr:hypothetical protein GN244_ATG04955 [Phytophthora infestans]